METLTLNASTRTFRAPVISPDAPKAAAACFHCGERCDGSPIQHEEKVFCCQGCRVVHDLLTETGLKHFYDLTPHPGVRVRRQTPVEQWAFLDDPPVQQRLLDFRDQNRSRITLQVPAIHCIACVWLLENLFRFHEGIGGTQVNFSKRQVSIQFQHEKIQLSELVCLLSTLGYEPRLTLNDLENAPAHSTIERRWLQIGIAGFCFGNIMLFSLPFYLGLNGFNAPLYHQLFGLFSLLLALPVLVYSASDFWRSAFVSIRRRILTLDVPIALGLAAIYAQSAWEVLSGRGGGYLDSLSGLVFFLLCGRAFQQKTQERIAFDRDYKCFFPLSVTRKTGVDSEQTVALSRLAVGDRLVLRHGELIPADGMLISGPALIDYSFVTGESEPVSKSTGDYVYAGGRQIGGRIELDMVKPVSQSYLTSLWEHEAFRKADPGGLDTLTNRYSRRFTFLVMAIAIGSLLFWLSSGTAGRGLKAFVSVLIVACPCALALAAPFTLGTAQRLLAGWQIFLKNALVLERMARIDAIVFDKTGTLTTAGRSSVTFIPASCPAAAEGPAGLSGVEREWIYSLVRHSTHPHAMRIGDRLRESCQGRPVRAFSEAVGAGIHGQVEGHELRIGSRRFLREFGIAVPDLKFASGSMVAVAIDGAFRGSFVLEHRLRPQIVEVIPQLGRNYEIALLSGDQEREYERFRVLFGSKAQLKFNQGPMEKLKFVRDLQAQGKTVMMIGDGLNDAGALQQSNVGVAVVETIGTFSPASDVIMRAADVPRLGRLLQLSRRIVILVKAGFGLSAAYNLVGISIAASGLLSPLICAVLMPLSSVSVVLFACGATSWVARKERFPST